MAPKPYPGVNPSSSRVSRRRNPLPAASGSSSSSRVTQSGGSGNRPAANTSRRQSRLNQVYYAMEEEDEDVDDDEEELPLDPFGLNSRSRANRSIPKPESSITSNKSPAPPAAPEEKPVRGSGSFVLKPIPPYTLKSATQPASQSKPTGPASTLPSSQLKVGSSTSTTASPKPRRPASTAVTPKPAPTQPGAVKKAPVGRISGAVEGSGMVYTVPYEVSIDKRILEGRVKKVKVVYRVTLKK